MSAEVQQRLFTPFFTTKPPGVGTGLGLTICQRIINGLGGEISVDSSPGRGTAFRVVLPISTTVSPISAEARPVTPAERRGRILVIDDEQELLTALRRTLAPPHEVITRLRAAEGLELIGAGERFDVILSDLMMPDMTGMELFGELSKVAPDQARRIVFVTGGAFTPKARAFLEEATNFHIEKPFDPADLQRLVQKVLGGRE
jgi:CheY-like chemotaxis protein